MNDHDKPGSDPSGHDERPQAPSAANDDATDATLEALEAALSAEAEISANPRIVELEGQVSDLTDRLLRAAAETENTRRRAEKERDDLRKFAVQRFAEDMLAVADNLARALDAIPAEARDSEAVKALVEGVELTGRELAGALERHGVRPIAALGQRFDPNRHQAAFEVESAEEPGTVVQVLRDGYILHDRLLRAAMVGVAKAAAD